MTPHRYRVTIDGGSLIASGNMARCVIDAAPTLKLGRRVYVRCNHDVRVVEFRRDADGHLTHNATFHGTVVDLPEWGDQFRSMFLHI